MIAFQHLDMDAFRIQQNWLQLQPDAGVYRAAGVMGGADFEYEQ